jgi:hypothetical protein
MFRNKNEIKLKNDHNTLSIGDLPEYVRDSLLRNIQAHMYCPKCGAQRILIITSHMGKGYNTLTGKQEITYTCKAMCSEKRHFPSSDFTMNYIRAIHGGYFWYP